MFDVVKWVVQLNNYKHDIRNSKRVSLINFLELEQETHNPSKSVTYFLISADKVMTTSLVLHTDCHISWEFSFRQLSTLQSILLGVFPWEWKKQTNKKSNKRWIYGSILKISRYCFLETRENLAFYVTALSRHIHLMFLSICS